MSRVPAVPNFYPDLQPSQIELAVARVAGVQDGLVSVRLTGHSGRVIQDVRVMNDANLMSGDEVLIARVMNARGWAVIGVLESTQFNLGQEANLYTPETVNVFGLKGIVLASWDGWAGATVCFMVQHNSTPEESGSSTFYTRGSICAYQADPDTSETRWFRVSSVYYDTKTGKLHYSGWTKWHKGTSVGEGDEDTFIKLSDTPTWWDVISVPDNIKNTPVTVPGAGTQSSGEGIVSWTDPSKLLDGGVSCAASWTLGATGDSEWLIARNFNLRIPEGCTILGIEVTVNGRVTHVDDTESVQLYDHDLGAVFGTAKTGSDWVVGATNPPVDVVYGDDEDLWGSDTSKLTITFVNSEDFGIAVKVNHSSAITPGNANVWYIKIKVYYEAPIYVVVIDNEGDGLMFINLDDLLDLAFTDLTDTPDSLAGALYDPTTGADTGLELPSSGANVDDSEDADWSATNEITDDTIPDSSDPGWTVQDDYDECATAASIGQNEVTNWLVATNFGISGIPADATITGIEVEINRRASWSGFKDVELRLWPVTGDNMADTVTEWPNDTLDSEDATVTHGASDDDWGATLTPADVMSSGFGVALKATQTGLSGQPYVNYIKIKVYYSMKVIGLCVSDDRTELKLYDLSGAAGGASTFKELTDTPSAAGSSGQQLRWNASGNLENFTPTDTGTFQIVAVIGDGSNNIPTGLAGYLPMRVAGTIQGWYLVGDDAANSIVVDVWKDTWANFPPTSGDSIAASAKPTLSSAQKNSDTTLTGWTTSISAGDVLAFNVDSVGGTVPKRVTLVLEVEK